MDEGRIESTGVAPLRATLTEIRRAKDRAAIAALMGRHVDDFEGTLFGLAIDIDIKAPSKYALYTFQAGFGLPDRDYYLIGFQRSGQSTNSTADLLRR
jgi:putative endopeptidase